MTSDRKIDAQPPSTLLVLTQVYVPDPASVGQHMHDAAAEMGRRGHRVIVYCANRGYDDPTQKYPRHEVRDAVSIRRLPLSSLGKKSLLHRVVAQLSFLTQCIVRGCFVRRLDRIFISTSPPMCAFAALCIAAIRRVPISYWVMDLNPDQVIVMGRMKPTALPVRMMNMLNRAILGRAQHIVALDRFMAQRLNRKRDVTDKMLIMPPWPHESHLQPIAHADNPFRATHQLQNKFVIMYSGNHSPANPLDTLLETAMRLRDQQDLLFMFIGGGGGKKQIDDQIAQHHPPHIVSLPYQPLSQIKYSLSAADLHVVTMGNEVVGCVHPCKVYGAMAIGRPILYFGPRPSHVSDLLDEAQCGWHLDHGDVDGAVALLNRIRQLPPAQLQQMGENGRKLVEERYGRDVLLPKFVDRVLSSNS
ncbi:MAG: glycosyltransferase family 4 protein [Phycisphaeraceae bacterium]|nr:glycosyltransferase family 4 protein [Phycisphaeraceae bacterium]